MAVSQRLTLYGHPMTLQGGALRILRGSVTLTDCLMRENTASSQGGAIYKSSGATLIVTDTATRLVGNTPAQACPSGQYISSIEELGFTCTTCAQGETTPDAGYFVCRVPTCPLGQEHVIGTSGCRKCSAGSFRSDVSHQSCTLCPIGKHASNEGSTGCENCPLRTYSDAPGLVNCKTCAPGTSFDAQSQSQSPSQSGGGGGAGTGGRSTPCVNCPAGTFRDTNIATTAADNECKACAAGTSSQAGASTCDPCTAGKFARTPGLASCMECPAGTFQSDPGSLFCKFCDAGKASATPGAASCAACPAGKGTKEGASTMCHTCGPGRFAKGETENLAKGCMDCESGKFQELTGSTSCLACDFGRFAGQAAS